MEIDLVVQKKQKANSSEIETKLMQPNEVFWRFTAEIQPSDITSSCFAEELDIMQNDDIVGKLNVSIKRDGTEIVDGHERPILKVSAETNGKNDEFEIFQSIESTITEDMNLIREVKIEKTQLLTKTITTEYIPGHGYRVERVIENKVTEDNDLQQPQPDDVFEMVFLCDTAKVVLSDGTAIFVQRLLPKIGVYQIDLPYLDIDAKLVSLSSLTALGFKTINLDGEEIDLVGIQRTHHLKYGPHVYNLWLFEDGHIAQRESSGGKIQLKVAQKPELIKDEDDLEPVMELPSLDWHDDMQLKSIYRQRATELSSSHATYLTSNDQMMKLLRDFYTSVLCEKPNDIYNYAAEYFDAYAPTS